MKRGKWKVILCFVLLIFVSLSILSVVLKKMNSSTTLEPDTDTDKIINVGDDDTTISGDIDNSENVGIGNETEKPDYVGSGDETDSSSDDNSSEDSSTDDENKSFVLDSNAFVYNSSVEYDPGAHFADLDYELSSFEGFVCIKVNPEYVGYVYFYSSDEGFSSYSDYENGIFIGYISSSFGFQIGGFAKDVLEAEMPEYIFDLYIFNPCISGRYKLALEPEGRCCATVNFTVESGSLLNSDTNTFTEFDVEFDDFYFDELKVGSSGVFIDNYVINFGDEPQDCSAEFYFWFLKNAVKQ